VPEAPEANVESLRDQIDEEIERKGEDGGRMIRLVALSTAILAALAAIASLKAGATVNEALVLKTEATQLQAQASDQWTYYQAKGIKGAIAASTVATWHAAGKTPPAAAESAVVRYAAEQKAIMDSARATEHERDTRSEEADVLLHQHHGFAYAVAFFQIAIALGAVSALTRSRPVLGLSILGGVVGIVLMTWHFLIH
jgi:hypothetical protein